jgi:O-antigen ligase
VRRVKEKTATASWAYAGLLLFIFVVYANPGNWFDGLADVGFAKIAAAAAVTALVGSWLLYGHRVGLGGWPGLLVVALFAWVGFSALWSYWPGRSMDTFLDGTKYLAVFLLAMNVIDREERLGGLVRALAWATLIPAFGGISSWLRGEHLVDGDRASWIGIFGNPNDLAYHLVVGIAMILAARDAAPRRGARLVYLAMLVPVGFCLLITQSRGGMLAAGAVLTFWLLTSLRARASTAITRAAGVLLVVGCVFYLSPGNPWTSRMESSVAYGEDVSARGRIDAWRTGLNMAAERPLIGVGAGAFMVAWPDFAPGDAGPARTEHNTFIQLVGELGFPGLLFFVLPLGAAVIVAGRAARVRELKSYARGVQCGLAGFAVCSLWGGLAFSWPVYLLLGAAFAARRLALERATETELAAPPHGALAAGAR